MKRFIYFFLFLSLILPSNSWAQTATANAGAGATANVNNAPKTESSVVIDNHSKTRVTNRQFLPLGSIPPAGTMQLFLPPREFGAIWNFQLPIKGDWECTSSLQKIKVKHFKFHLYVGGLASQKKVTVTFGKVAVKGALVAEVSAEASKEADSRELQQLIIDRLAQAGANLVVIERNGIKFIPQSHYSGFILGGSAGGVIASGERAAVTGGSGIGAGSTELQIQTYPVVQAKGYRGVVVASPPTPTQSTAPTTEKSHDGKKWETISH